MKKHSDNFNEDGQILPWIWSANALLFTVADFRNLLEQGDEFWSYAQEGKKQMLLETAVLCDYYTRKYNRGYNSDGVDTPEVFLLCGAFRYICSYSYTDEDFTYITLPPGAIEDYSFWLSKEKQLRYRALLYRLLSYTDYPIKDLELGLQDFPEKQAPEYEGWQKLFLPYDRIPNEEDFIANPRLLKFD